MHPKCSVYIAASIDGFIAREDGDIEWLHNPEYSVSKMKGLSYDDFISSVDALVMGRNSFEKVLTFGDWPYNKTPVIVLTSRDLDVPNHLKGKVTVRGGSPKELVADLGKEGKKHLYIDGGNTIQRFLKARVINEITITIIPILLGKGISLFGNTGIELPLKLIDSIGSDNGFVQVRYKAEINE